MLDHGILIALTHCWKKDSKKVWRESIHPIATLVLGRHFSVGTRKTWIYKRLITSISANQSSGTASSHRTHTFSNPSRKSTFSKATNCAPSTSVTRPPWSTPTPSKQSIHRSAYAKSNKNKDNLLLHFRGPITVGSIWESMWLRRSILHNFGGCTNSKMWDIANVNVHQFVYVMNLLF